MHKTRGFFALVAAAIIYSFYGVFIRTQAASFSNYAQLTFRTAIALFIVLIIIIKNSWRLPKKERPFIFMFGLANTIYPLALVVSTRHIKASNSVMMLYVGGIVSAFLLGTLFLKEKITRMKLASILIALAGLAIFAFPYELRGAALFGVMVGLMAGLFDAISNSLRKFIKDTPREVLLFVSFSTLVVLLGFATIASKGPAITHSVELPGYITLAVHACCIVFVGYLLIYGFKNLDVNIGTVVLASEIFISLVVNRIFLQEAPTIYEFIGALVIFGASILIGCDGLRQHKKAPILIGDLE